MQLLCVNPTYNTLIEKLSKLSYKLISLNDMTHPVYEINSIGDYPKYYGDLSDSQYLNEIFNSNDITHVLYFIDEINFHNTDFFFNESIRFINLLKIMKLFNCNNICILFFKNYGKQKNSNVSDKTLFIYENILLLLSKFTDIKYKTITYFLDHDDIFSDEFIFQQCFNYLYDTTDSSKALGGMINYNNNQDKDNKDEDGGNDNDLIINIDI